MIVNMKSIMMMMMMMMMKIVIASMRWKKSAARNIKTEKSAMK